MVFVDRRWKRLQLILPQLLTAGSTSGQPLMLRLTYGTSADAGKWYTSESEVPGTYTSLVQWSNRSQLNHSKEGLMLSNQFWYGVGIGCGISLVLIVCALVVRLLRAQLRLPDSR